MLNWRIVAAWPNWLVIPTMLAFWVIIGVLMAELFGAAPHHSED